MSELQINIDNLKNEIYEGKIALDNIDADSFHFEEIKQNSGESNIKFHVTFLVNYSNTCFRDTHTTNVTKSIEEFR